jgi:aspartyl protease family protein
VDEQKTPVVTRPRTGRTLAWLAVIGLMVGLTAFYQALIPDRGGMVMSGTQGGEAMIVLERDRSGHYRVEGEINGHTVGFLVDTGATDVAVSERTARAIGLEFGPKTMVMTAAGPASAWKTRIARVSAGSLVRENVRATITPGLGGEALLGMSFLRHYSIRQQDDRLVIESTTAKG